MAEGDAPKVIGEFSDYNGMIAALRARAAELNLSGETIDAVSGLPSRYSAKLLGPHQLRRIGATSLGPFLGALAVRCLIIEDKAALERLRRQARPRNGSFVRATCTLLIVTDKRWRRLQKLGGKARWNGIPKAQRSQIMRAVRAARERKRREQNGAP
jgi:hypothetical protein